MWWKCLCVEALCFRLPVCPPAFSTASECKAVCESSCPGECLHLNEWRSNPPTMRLRALSKPRKPFAEVLLCLRVFPVSFFCFFLFFSPSPPVLHFLRSISLREQNYLVIWESPNRLMKHRRSDQPHIRHILLLIEHRSAAIC